MKKMFALTVAVALLCVFTGCANPEIVRISPNTYMLSRQDRAGVFGNSARLKANVIADANEFAESQGKVAVAVSTTESPMWPTHFASVEYQFKVLDKNDPEAQRTSLVPRADLVVESTEKIAADIRTKDQSEKAEDVYAELIKLDDLKKKGIITEAEFEMQKKRLLSGT